VTEAFSGTSDGGIYGDVIEELDWNVGRILDTLSKEGLDEKTYVFFLSDNGPWYFGRSRGHLKRIGPEAVTHGGSALPLRGAKTSTWEGGLRVPCIMRAPGRIPAGEVYDKLACTLDLLPTLASLAGLEPPSDRIIDGHDLTDMIHGVQGAKRGKDVFYYYQQTSLQAVRSGDWKLHLPGFRHWPQYSMEADAGPFERHLLYHLGNDLGETTDVSAENPEVVAELLALAENARADIGDVDRVGEGARFFDGGPRRPDIKKK
ncbi:MAG: sulfatase-like hydrolase/transferase, partial [Verrucomicrobiota bacterium]